MKKQVTDDKGYRSPTGYEPAQLEMIELYQFPRQERWTRAVALYDALPKFLFSKNKKFAEAKAGEAMRVSCEWGGQTFSVLLNPAQVSDAKTPFFAYPGEREELVSRALRYLAVQQGISVSVWEHPSKPGQIRIHFSLHQIITLLAKWGHTYNSRQIDEALTILQGSKLVVETSTVDGQGDRKQTVYKGQLIPEYFAQDDKGNPSDQGRRRVVVLNSLEADAIIKGQYRALNFERLMSLQSPLARRLFEYVMTHHLGAEKPPQDETGKTPKPYLLALSTILREGCIQRQKDLPETINRVRAALNELKEQGILWAKLPYAEEITYSARQAGKRGRREIADVVWSVFLSLSEVRDLIASNSESAAFSGKDPVFERIPDVQKASLRKQAKDRLQ